MSDISIMPLDTESGIEIDGETGIHDYPEAGGRISSLAGCPVSPGVNYNLKETNIITPSSLNPGAEQRAYRDPQVI